ncbi:unnamed protein product [Caenorhabditis auriculariae]|uniref:Uncharacterized protein n=1 Tax=Caenorhabditis auriculariae TaxID=2777116 RepID=A0A8S1HHN8_9PELO|nr:unnamed protein product [Caenorhabditis auriculariae]
MAGANMYRVGDFVYFEESSDAPYQIRRIEELNKTQSGVEARVVLYHRRRDISPALLKISDQAVRRFDNYYEVDKKKPENFSDASGFILSEPNGSETKPEEDEKEGEKAEEATEESTKKADWGNGGLPLGAENIGEEARFRLRQHELFLSRQVEIMPASQIRGKCRVMLLSEAEDVDSYTSDDLFFYSLVYDPNHMTLLADKGAIRVGDKFQAVVENDDENDEAMASQTKNDVPEMEIDEDEDNENGLKIDEEEDVKPKTSSEKKSAEEEEDRDVLVFKSDNGLTDRDIDQFIILARSVGVFARSMDVSSSAKLPSLHMTVACASRDITLLHAIALLHQADYDFGRAVKFLVPPPNRQLYPLDIDKATGSRTTSLGGPLLCRDQMEEWSAPEANLFEEALDKYGKDFNDIRADYLPWKSMRDIVEYYYQYKASNRYADHKKKKQADADSKLKQVYIPSFSKPSPNIIGQLNQSINTVKSSVSCENCKTTESTNWYSWGPSSAQLRLCQSCWVSWKKNGGLQRKHEHDLYDKSIAKTINNGAAASESRPAPPLISMKPIASNVAQVVAQLPANHPLVLASRQQQAAQKASSSFSFAAIAGLTPQALAKLQQAGGRPGVLFYTTVWRRAIRRALPRNVLNIRRLSRRPFLSIDNDAIARATATLDKTTLLTTAKGLQMSNFNDAKFIQGLYQMQCAFSAQSMKRSSTTLGAHPGEPHSKQQKQAGAKLVLKTRIPPSTFKTPIGVSTPVVGSLHLGNSAAQHQLFTNMALPIATAAAKMNAPQSRIDDGVTPSDGSLLMSATTSQNNVESRKIPVPSHPPSDSKWSYISEDVFLYLGGRRLK